MHVRPITPLWQRFRDWLQAHRPLRWLERGFIDLEGWRPDPPVMDRLIR